MYTNITCNFISSTNKPEARLTINFNVVLFVFWSTSGFDRGSLFPRLSGSTSSTWWRRLTITLFIKSGQPSESAVWPDNMTENLITLLHSVSIGVTSVLLVFLWMAQFNFLRPVYTWESASTLWQRWCSRSFWGCTSSLERLAWCTKKSVSN